MATARTYLDEYGLEGLTLREIARRAGVSHGAPLRHFDSLAALCSVVATEAFEGLYGAVADAMATAGDEPRTRLQAAGHAYVRFAVANPGAYSLMFRPDRSPTCRPQARPRSPSSCSPCPRPRAPAGTRPITPPTLPPWSGPVSTVWPASPFSVSWTAPWP